MQLIDPAVAADPGQLCRQFRQADPFRHLVIDGFLAGSFAEQLLAEFPAFERGNARNEDGALGGKSVVEQIRGLGPAFAALDDLVQGETFLDWLTQATGIPALLYDPHYFGGGTHDNRSGQELDPHIDFNRHPANGWHRRLNLIVYLNHDWQPEFGGALELHSDPRADDDRISLITPAFNRCVVFETTEWSWHGFSRITLPPAAADRSRKSIALYFYTRERPAEELADRHSTIYVDRPLPERFAPGYTLGAEDVQELKVLLKRRDMHNERLYQDTIQLQARLDRAEALWTSGEGPAPGSARLLLRGLRAILQRSLRSRRLPERNLIKQAMIPFANSLPERWRERLRRLWRRGNARARRSSPSDRGK